MTFDEALMKAVSYRRSLGSFDGTEALRVFYGPGESDHSEWKHVAIDCFQNHFWLTTWKPVSESSRQSIVRGIQSVFSEAASVVWMNRSQVASESDSALLWGKAPEARFTVNEYGVPYRVQMIQTKHPGLFLDHAPLRQWLLRSQNGKSVLNLFSYTGSLSIAAARGGARHVTTLDLSKATIDWAKENWTNAGYSLGNEDARTAPRGDFIFGDVFEWLPKFRKRADQFDTILCDPPSFSRSKNGTFSTQKDTSKLHELIFPLLKPGGVLVTSINSENVSERNFMGDLENAAMLTRTDLRVLGRVDLPETFPTGTDLHSRYLKGFYLLRV